MARERIINLRRLSTEPHSASLRLPSVTIANQGCASESDEDDQTAVDHKSDSDSGSGSHSRDREGRRNLVRLTKSYQDDVDHVDDDDEEEETNQNVALMRHHPPAHVDPTDNNLDISSIPPRIEVMDTGGLIASSLDPFLETLEMGKFMDQVTKVSTGIDSIEMDLNDHQTSFQQGQTFRLELYRKIEQEITPNLVQLQANTSLSSTHRVDNDGQIHHSNVPDENSIRDLTISFGRDIENPLKREQINLLASKLNSILYRLKDYLSSEKRMLANGIKYEWNKEFSRYSLSNRRSTLKSTGDAADFNLLQARDDDDDDDDDSIHQSLFQMIGIDAIDHVSLPDLESNSNEIHKRLTLAVRSSTSYPQARKSSLIILSEFDQIKQIQIELEQINFLIKLLEKNSLHRPPPDETTSEDDSSSISFSLDGLDQDESRLETSNYSEKRLSKQDALKRQEAYKKIKFSFNAQHESISENRVKYDLENNRHRYSLTNDQSFSNKSLISTIVHWFYRYRFSLFISSLISFLLGCAAVGFYFVLRRHEN